MSSIYRFGVLVNSNLLKQWQLDSILKILSLGHHLVLVVENMDSNYSSGKFEKYFGRNGLFNFYEKYFLRSGSMKNVDATLNLSHIDRLKVRPNYRGKYSQYFDSEDIEIVKTYNLDFILRFGFNILRGEILNIPKYGVWSFHHDDEQLIRGGPPGFWEIFYGHTKNGIVLQRLTDDLDAGLIIFKSHIAITSHSYSTHLNELLGQSCNLLEFSINRLQYPFNINWLKANSEKVKIYKKPSNIQMTFFLLRLLYNRIKFNWFDLFFHEVWTIGIIKQSAYELIHNQLLNKVSFYKNLPKASFFADPFFTQVNSEISIFFENYQYMLRKGNISVMSYSLISNQFGSVKDLIEKPFHLAFPFYIYIDHKHLLLAESSKSGNLVAYEINANFDKKISESIWMSADCIDSVFFEKDDLKWLFCTHQKYGSNVNLFAYYQELGSKDWSSHAANPIVSDVSKARMAGNIFELDGVYYRPAQKNDLVYGEKIRMFKIVDLSINSYLEEEVFEINANAFDCYNSGIHTIAIENDIIVIDAKKYKFILSEFIYKLKRKLHL